MRKKVIIGIIIALVVIAVAVTAVILVNNNNSEKNNLPNRDESNLGTSKELENKGNEEKQNVKNEVANDSKILVAYFSLPETNNPNNMTQEEENSAIVVNGEVLGNTQYVAQLISENTGADIFRIEAQNDYPLNHTTLVDQARREQDEDARPAIKNTIQNIDEYDTIFIGYPIWWGDMPQILYTFLEQYDFSGKTIIPFSTHGGSGLAGTVSKIKNKLTSAKVIENAFTMSRNNMEQAPAEVEKWLNGLDF